MSGERAALLLGPERLLGLKQAFVIVVGVGGVGGWVVELLARAGVGRIRLIDRDVVSNTDLNRQLVALVSQVGRPKVESLAARIRDIHPEVLVEPVYSRWTQENAAQMLAGSPSAVVDCIDTVADKVDLLAYCLLNNLPVYSSMGAGGRLDPTRVHLGALRHTRIDPLARVVRDQLRERGLPQDLPCVWSDEPLRELHGDDLFGDTGHLRAQGSVSWIPSLFGVKLAGLVLNRLIAEPVWGLDHEAGRHSERGGAPVCRTPPARKSSRERQKALLEGAGYGRKES